MALEQALQAFVKTHKFKGKGPLCVALVVTYHARKMGLPLKPETLLTEQGGQVLGLGVARVQSVLATHGIDRVLAAEGGRTSRGSISNMRAYTAFLNGLTKAGTVDIDAVEQFWINRVLEFFAGKPFTLKLDNSLGLRTVVRNLLSQAEERQKQASGTMYHGMVMQHLVGAKIDLLYGVGAVVHHGANTSDQNPDRTGDFDIGDVSIHVSVSPAEALIRKCAANLEAGRKPMIVTGKRGLLLAEGLAENAGIADRLDVIEFEQFIATNIHELGAFEQSKRKLKVEELVQHYNRIVETYETDPSLKITLSSGK
jgi:hypothetical protein